MHPQQLESLTKAGQCAELLASDIREAQRLARRDQPVLAILLWELLAEVNRVSDRLAELQSTADGARCASTLAANRRVGSPWPGGVHGMCAKQAVPLAPPHHRHSSDASLLQRSVRLAAPVAPHSTSPSSGSQRTDEHERPATAS